MSSITYIGTAVPEYANKQTDILEFMLKLKQDGSFEKRKLKLMYARSGIETRYSVIPDYSCPAAERVLFPQNEALEPFPGVEQRMRKYKEAALPLALKAVHKALGAIDVSDKITHLITVSCTGMSAPGLDIELVEALKLQPDIYRTSVNFMGCYAAIHAFKQADLICKSEPHARVLVVLVELCTLHFQKEDTPDFLTSNLLFGDGAACCLIENSTSGIHIEGFYSRLFPEKQDSMAWDIHSNGFLMTLNQEVPSIVEQQIGQFVEASLLKNGFSKNQITNWAIHPGGRRILDVTARTLQISRDHMKESYEVLNDFGNMSSCTLVFILERMKASQKGYTFVAGFGPGITMESAILRIL
jgi:predicted naringenin-chalcone synthase